jgi:2-polyprenyl-3-methyl-5-hydroxy-6-metoxy-1,4-benzoquinol methylase
MSEPIANSPAQASADSRFSKFDHCPACGSAQSKVTGEKMQPLTTSVGGRDFVQPSYTILECTECGLLYKSAVMGQEEMNAYYKAVDFQKWEIPGLFPTERIVLGLIGKLPRHSRILDFGCSSGRLLSSLVSTYECLGSEMNTVAASRASERGLRMLSDTEFTTNPPRDLDAVVLMDVFEHLTTPVDLLSKLTSCLKPGGKLIIGTGNGDAPACRRDPSQFWYFRNVEHVCMITRRHAQFLCDSNDLRLESWRECSHYDTPLRDIYSQKLRDFAYWQFFKAPVLKRLALTMIPVFNRARNWPCAPALTCTADHVVAVFVKPGL